MSQSVVVEKNIKLHEKEAQDYEDEKIEIYNQREQDRIRSVLSEAKGYIDTGNSNLKALDVGCGTGNVLGKLDYHFDEVFGVDLSDDMLSEAVSQAEGINGRLVKGEVSDLPFPDNYFDFVSAYSLLHHLPNFSEPISEIARVLEEGGVFYVDHEPVERGMFLVKSYIKFCDILNGESCEGLPPYDETEGREYCDYHLHHGEDVGVPISELVELLNEKGFEVIEDRKYLTYGTEDEGTQE